MLPTGLEPARLFKQRILSPLRLPFPSQEHGCLGESRTHNATSQSRIWLPISSPDNVKVLVERFELPIPFGPLILNQRCIPIPTYKHGCP